MDMYQIVRLFTEFWEKFLWFFRTSVTPEESAISTQIWGGRKREETDGNLIAYILEMLPHGNMVYYQNLTRTIFWKGYNWDVINQ